MQNGIVTGSERDQDGIRKGLEKNQRGFKQGLEAAFHNRDRDQRFSSCNQAQVPKLNKHYKNISSQKLQNNKKAKGTISNRQT